MRSKMFVTVKAVKMEALGVVLKQLLRKEISEELEEEEEETLVERSIGLKEGKGMSRKQRRVRRQPTLISCITELKSVKMDNQMMQG